MDTQQKRQVNKGKHDPLYNTENMLPISEIQQDTIITKDGGLKAVIKIEGINVDLKEGQEIEIIIEKYKKFLNGLDFPVQILVRNTYLDLTPYISYVQVNTNKITNYNLKEQAKSYLSFLENINLQQGLIFVKQFYVVIPYYTGMQSDNDAVKKPRWQKMIDVLDGQDSAEKVVSRYRLFLKNKQKLDTRANLIIDGLRGLGMQADRLEMQDLVALMFSQYNPIVQNSQSQRSGGVI